MLVLMMMIMMLLLLLLLLLHWHGQLLMLVHQLDRTGAGQLSTSRWAIPRERSTTHSRRHPDADNAVACCRGVGMIGHRPRDRNRRLLDAHAGSL